MVMEASPSPQSVGREFVRQYYTLLNKAPAHLHRFYNNYSSFVHGGLDAPNRETLPVVGQKQIHNRIQQLNFRDCHAKISQVDAQATLGSGVVVQVTGELSNGGAPMRRFTQTFVLAAQSPKKYYVHNDIFRYQDVVFTDEEGSGSGRSEGEEEEARGYFPPPPAFPPPAFPPAPPRDDLAPPPPPLNGHPPPLNTPSLSSEEPSAPEPEPEPEPEPLLQEYTPPPVAEASPPPPASPPAPKTYANLLKSVSAGGPGPATGAGPGPAAGGVARQAAGAPEPRRFGRAPEAARRYSDLQQVFVGNVPGAAEESTLRAVFARYGPVAELRLHSKPQQGRQAAYGFVTYSSAAGAAACLAAAAAGAVCCAAPGCAEPVKLNVEEKKARGGAVLRRRPARR